MEEIKINLTINEVNNVLLKLQKFPYEEVAGLIQKIQQQGEAQFNDLQQKKQSQMKV